jgi:hypothetical protein
MGTMVFRKKKEKKTTTLQKVESPKGENRGRHDNADTVSETDIHCHEEKKARLDVHSAMKYAALSAKKNHTDAALEQYQSLKKLLLPYQASLWATEQSASISFIMGILYEQKADAINATTHYKEAYSLYSEMRKKGAVDGTDEQKFQAELKTILVLEVMGRVACKHNDFHLANELYGAATAFLAAGMEAFNDFHRIKQWTVVKNRLTADYQLLEEKRQQALPSPESREDESLVQTNTGTFLSLTGERGSETWTSLGESTFTTDDDSTVHSQNSKLADLEFMNIHFLTLLSGASFVAQSVSKGIDRCGIALVDK